MRDNNIKPAEAADILGVSPQFVRVAMQQGKLNMPFMVMVEKVGGFMKMHKVLDTLQRENIQEDRYIMLLPVKRILALKSFKVS